MLTGFAPLSRGECPGCGGAGLDFQELCPEFLTFPASNKNQAARATSIKLPVYSRLQPRRSVHGTASKLTSSRSSTCLTWRFLWSASRARLRTCILGCHSHPRLTWFSLSHAVPSQPPENVRALSITSDVAVISWSEPPRSTLNGVLKGYRVIFWSLYVDGGESAGPGNRRWIGGALLPGLEQNIFPYVSSGHREASS